MMKNPNTEARQESLRLYPKKSEKSPPTKTNRVLESCECLRLVQFQKLVKQKVHQYGRRIKQL